jgi:hypothetical protein
MKDKPAYRNNMTVETGGVPRRTYGTRKQIKEAAHTLVIQAIKDVSATVPEAQRDWANDLRRGRRSIYGGLFRFIDLLHRRKVPMETALEIPEALVRYIREVWVGNPGDGAVLPSQIWTTGEHRKVG